MRLTNSILFLILFTTGLFAQKYNEKLAKSYGADDYGMKPYILVILKTGNYEPVNKAEKDSLFKGHMANIGRLARENLLTVAGPLGKNDKNYRGIFILNVKTIEEARKLTQTDPAVNSGLLDVEFYNWYGAAALPVYLKTQKRITKSKI
ncbi:MAG: YciI family protein [Paludibacter sp.]